ncbi:hypothetical protein Emag_003010 [Eimeria magna]
MDVSFTKRKGACFAGHLKGLAVLPIFLLQRIAFNLTTLSSCPLCREKALQNLSSCSRPLRVNGDKGLHLCAAARRSFSCTTEQSAGRPCDKEVGSVEHLRLSGLSETPCSKLRVLARRRYTGSFVTATYEPHLRKLVLSISPVLRPTGGVSEETAAAAATADRLIRAASVCEAAEPRVSQRGRLEASAVSALVDYALAGGPAKSLPLASAAPLQRQAVSFHLPCLSPAALSELVYLCAFRLGVRDHDFFSEVTRVSLWQLDVLQRLRGGGSSPPRTQHQPFSGRDCDVRRCQKEMMGQGLEGLEKMIFEAPVASSPRPGAHQVAKLLRGLCHAGYKDHRLFHAAVDYLEKECTYTHSDLLHALALLKVMSPGASRDKLARLLSQRILLRERRLPLCVIGAAANVFSLLQLPRCESSSLREAASHTLQMKEPLSLEAFKTSLCATHTNAHATLAVSSSLPSRQLFESLASSAKRAFEVSFWGIGGGARGRDLALLARGFVRARQQSAAMPWVQSLERHWKDLGPSFEPHSLSLLIVSLSKLQRGLPARSDCLTDLLHVFMQRAGSMSQQQLVMVAAGLSRLSSRVGYPPTALTLTWRFLLKDPQLLALNYTWVQSLLAGLRRQEGTPLPSAISALSKLFANFEDVQGLPSTLRDEALAFQGKFGALEGHVVKALIESALNSAECTLGAVVRCLCAVARLPGRPSAAVPLGSQDPHFPHAAVIKEEEGKACLLALVQNRLKALLTDEKRHWQRASEAAAAALSAFCCLTLSQRCNLPKLLCQRLMSNFHSGLVICDEPTFSKSQPARAFKDEALSLQYELVPKLARLLASKSEVSGQSETSLWEGAAAVVNMTFHLRKLAQTQCASEKQQAAAFSFELEQLEAAMQVLLNAVTSKLAQKRFSSNGVLPSALACWLAFSSSMCRRGVQMLNQRTLATHLIDECTARSTAGETHSNTSFTTEEREGLSQPHRAINTTHHVVPAVAKGLDETAAEELKRWSARLGLFRLAELLTALLALRLRTHLLHHQNEAFKGDHAEIHADSSSVGHLAVQRAITSAASAVLSVIKSTNIPKSLSCGSDLYSILAISAQVIKALEPLIWERHTSALHHLLKALAPRSAVQHYPKSVAFSLGDGGFDTPLWSWAASKRKASQAVMLAVESLTSAVPALHSQATRTTESSESRKQEKVTLLSTRALPLFGSIRGLQVEIEQGATTARVVFVVISSDDFLVPVWASSPHQEAASEALQYTVCWQHELHSIRQMSLTSHW